MIIISPSSCRIWQKKVTTDTPTKVTKQGLTHTCPVHMNLLQPQKDERKKENRTSTSMTIKAVTVAVLIVSETTSRLQLRPQRPHFFVIVHNNGKCNRKHDSDHNLKHGTVQQSHNRKQGINIISQLLPYKKKNNTNFNWYSQSHAHTVTH